MGVDECADSCVTWKYAGFGTATPRFEAAAVIPFVSAWMSRELAIMWLRCSWVL